MNDLKKMVVDNVIYKIALAIISIVSILTVLLNARELSFILFLYAPMSILYYDMYKKSKISTTGNVMTTLNAVIYVLSFPGYLLFQLAKFALTAILSIAKITTPKFKHKKRKW